MLPLVARFVVVNETGSGAIARWKRDRIIHVGGVVRRVRI